MPKQTIRAHALDRRDTYLAPDGQTAMTVSPDDLEFHVEPVRDGVRYLGPVADVVRVGWSVEHGVQLVVGTALAHDLGDFVHVQQSANDPHKVPLSRGVDLDRTAINDVIRALRTARDRAFGRDE